MRGGRLPEPEPLWLLLALVAGRVDVSPLLLVSSA
jgi:hypothetical protein